MVTPSSYRLQALDTSIATDRFEFDLRRQRSNGDRPLKRMTLTEGARDLCLYDIKRTYTSDDRQDTLLLGELHQPSCCISKAGVGPFYWNTLKAKPFPDRIIIPREDSRLHNPWSTHVTTTFP